MTISARDGSRPLQMVSKTDTRRCVSLLVVPRRRVDTRRCANKDAGSQRGVDLGAVLHRLKEGKSANEDAGTLTLGPKGGWIWGRSRID